MKKFVAFTVLALTATGACARDDRHLRFASTPTESAQAGTANATPRDQQQAPYALTGRRNTEEARPARTNLQTWVVGTPHFRPGK
jgi:hypothetical protein